MDCENFRVQNPKGGQRSAGEIWNSYCEVFMTSEHDQLPCPEGYRSFGDGDWVDTRNVFDDDFVEALLKLGNAKEFDDTKSFTDVVQA